MDQNETKAYLRLVFGTLSIIGVLTAINVLMIMNRVGTNIFKPLQRNIAAVTTEPAITLEKIKSPVIEINCRKKPKTLKINTKASSARVTFKNCKKVGRLINESNQNQGDIFPMNRNQWTSDFIFLKPGLNQIQAPLGKKTQTIEITREVVKKKASAKAL